MRGFILLLAGLAVAAVSLVLARFPGVVEGAYGQGLGPVAARWLSLASGWSPVSLSAVLLAVLLAWGAWKAWVGVRAVGSGETTFFAALAGGAAWTAGLAGVLLLAFYLFWGLNYARAPVDQRLGLEVTPEGEAEALTALARYAADRTNQAYILLHQGADDSGDPSQRPGAREVSESLRVGWRRVAPALGLSPAAALPYGPVKTAGVTRLLNFFDILGVYSPFTGEAHVSGDIPGIYFGATAAHEEAHQRGITRENEATFAGLLAAIHADDPYLRYSGWARATFALLGDLSRADPEAYRRIYETLAPGVRRDWEAYVRWVRENRGPGGAVATRVNDAYLRTHAVPGGTLDYGRVTELLLAWAERYEGRLTVLPGVRTEG